MLFKKKLRVAGGDAGGEEQLARRISPTSQLSCSVSMDGPLAGSAGRKKNVNSTHRNFSLTVKGDNQSK